MPSRHEPLTSTEPGATRIHQLLRRLRQTSVIENRGRVSQVIGLVIESEGPLAAVGEVCRIESARHDGPIFELDR